MVVSVLARNLIAMPKDEYIHKFVNMVEIGASIGQLCCKNRATLAQTLHNTTH